jgi:hypothetical protein
MCSGLVIVRVTDSAVVVSWVLFAPVFTRVDSIYSVQVLMDEEEEAADKLMRVRSLLSTASHIDQQVLRSLKHMWHPVLNTSHFVSYLQLGTTLSPQK